MTTTVHPWLASNPDELYRRFVELSKSGVLCKGRGVIYPEALWVNRGLYVTWQDGHLWAKADVEGLGSRPLTKAEVGEFHTDLEADMVRVCVRTRPGFGSDYGIPRVLAIFHEPCGSSFRPTDKREVMSP